MRNERGDSPNVWGVSLFYFQKCEVCYACLHNCPKTAIRMPVEADPMRFRNEHVTLAGIIQANA